MRMLSRELAPLVPLCIECFAVVDRHRGQSRSNPHQQITAEALGPDRFQSELRLRQFERFQAQPSRISQQAHLSEFMIAENRQYFVREPFTQRSQRIPRALQRW